MRIMTEQEQERLIELWKNRISISKIAKILSYSESYIYYTIKKLKDNGTIKEDDRVPCLQERIKAMYLSGVTDLYDLADTFSLSKGYVYAVLRKSGVEYKRPTKYKKWNPNKKKGVDDKTQVIIDELKSGKTQAEIAKQFGVTRQWVHLIKKLYVKQD